MKTLALLRLVPLLALLAGIARAGYVEELADGTTVVHVKCWQLPDPTRTDTKTRADVAVVREFIRRYSEGWEETLEDGTVKRHPSIFEQRYRARYEADPVKYGRRDWSRVQIELEQFSGITIEGMGMDSGPLMAIAGGVAPDILYVNFRQSDTYIQEGFLYPLDKPEDNYLGSLTEEEKAFAIHPKVWPVIRRRGPSGREQVWALPFGGVLGKVILYRKDLLDAAGVAYPSNDWTWEDFLEACKKLTDPAKGTYGVRFGKGSSESWYWVTFLWSAGGEAMSYDAAQDQWRAAFASRAGAMALDFYTQLCSEPWVDETGRDRFGYAFKETEGGQKWDLGQIGFYPDYIDEKLFSTINPDITGMVAVPLGYPDENGVRHRGGELNSRMQGLFADIKDPVVRDAAWEFLRFHESKDAVRIRTRIMVEGGLGRFVNPQYLRLFGYEDMIRLAPQGWEETFEVAIDSGKPEPYGRNCQLVYHVMTKPMNEAEELAKAGRLPEDREERLALMQRLLEKGVAEANEKMIGLLTPRQLLVRRSVATALLAAIVAAFALMFRKLVRIFTPPKIAGVEQQSWAFRRYKWAYLLILPAALSIFFWSYLPLSIGSLMAFQNFRIMGGSEWVWVDNFANLLWDGEWWRSVWNSLRYSLLVVGMTFLPPVILAVLLQEIPRGKILFRTLFYLPAVITGLVVIYLWRSFYEKSEFGVLNSVVLKIPAIGFIAIGLLCFMILFFFAKRLWIHDSRWVAGICLLVGAGAFWFFLTFALRVFRSVDSPIWLALFQPMKNPFEWLDDPKTAMICCVLPMVWAGMGPGCLIYLAALKGIAPDFYEAADIDGATFIDKILFIVIPILKPLLIIQFVGVFIASWQSTAYILAMTSGAHNTEVAGLHIFYKAYLYLKFGPATAMAWVLGFMLIGFTVDRLRILSRLEFKTTGNRE
ncbi:MAG: extracellular solute-binding protein [Lentisphaeria bacterium]|jgi:multiple sugar transport system permease protein|nr:extracellular solute-binding protein [Lentisphaeria bacterium]